MNTYSLGEKLHTVDQAQVDLDVFLSDLETWAQIFKFSKVK